LCPIAYAAAMGSQRVAASRAPRIGIVPCLDAAARLRPGRRTHYADIAYAGALAEAGAVALYLADPGDPEELLDAVDGLLLPGGGDFPPATPYPPEVHFDLVPAEQLAFDAALLAAARARQMPVLAICYGMQLLALGAGGALHHHLPKDLPGTSAHHGTDREVHHGIRVAPGTRLASILGERPGPVNSRHHQGVAAPGAGLRVAARAEDGVIEAIEAEDGPEAPFVLGVQWHPETLEGPHRTRLFAAFARACALRA
jgi:putative glutamine amidotransferase